MRTLMLVFLMILAVRVNGQVRDTWVAFPNKDTTLIGYKNARGTVMIPPRFGGLTGAQKFDDVIAVTDDQQRSYYLNKRGAMFGVDSLYVFDFSYSCESEGFIRFKDPKADKVGLFNKDGNCVIPAFYDEMTNVRNGLVIALRGAKKVPSGEHFSWEGGRVSLLDTNNRVVIDSFTDDPQLNLFSIKIEDGVSNDEQRVRFPGSDGRSYSFIHFEKEFRNWLKTRLLLGFTEDQLIAASAPFITYYDAKNGWVRGQKKEFIHKNIALLKSRLLALNKADCIYQISLDGLNSYNYPIVDYQPYFDNCGEAKTWQFPVMSVIIDNKEKDEITQDQLTFLKTPAGYQLIEVSFPNGKLR